MNKQRSRAVATVIPYTNNATVMNSLKSPMSPVLPRKPPLTLQESGIFEEEDEEHEEEAEVELTSRATQTEAPSGELLQEVQRLQELRARIQERAAKITTTSVFHTTDPSKICLDMDPMIVQLAPYQERVRDLEVRLEVYEEAEKSREQEKRLSKQREEELLDENYRLTEKIYWLENELRIVREPSPDESNGESRSGMTALQRVENTVQNKHEVSGNLENFNDTQDSRDIASCESAAVQVAEACANNAVANCPQDQLDQANVSCSGEQVDPEDPQRSVTVC